MTPLHSGMARCILNVKILFRRKQATVNGDKLEKKHPDWQ